VEGDASNVADVGGGCGMEIDSMLGAHANTIAEPAVTAWLTKTNAQSLQAACRDAAQNKEFCTWMQSYLIEQEGTYSDEALRQMYNAKGLRCGKPPYPKSSTASSGLVVVPPRQKGLTLKLVTVATAGDLRVKAGQPSALSSVSVQGPHPSFGAPFFLDATWI
jgi:hypothetical protein